MWGIIIQSFNPNVPFEGFDLKHDEKDNSLFGRMYDVYGPSAINGFLDLDKKKMEFDKKYDGEDRIIKYQLREQRDIWLGSFFQKGYFYGEVYCELFSPGENPKYDWNNILLTARMSINGSEKWGESITQRMIDKGWFKKIKDEKTGEVLLEPSDNPPYKIG